MPVADIYGYGSGVAEVSPMNGLSSVLMNEESRNQAQKFVKSNFEAAFDEEGGDN